MTAGAERVLLLLETLAWFCPSPSVFNPRPAAATGGKRRAARQPASSFFFLSFFPDDGDSDAMDAAILMASVGSHAPASSAGRPRGAVAAGVQRRRGDVRGPRPGRDQDTTGRYTTPLTSPENNSA